VARKPKGTKTVNRARAVKKAKPISSSRSGAKNVGINIDEASNGFIVRESFEDRRGNFVSRNHIAKTKKEALTLSNKILGKS